MFSTCRTNNVLYALAAVCGLLMIGADDSGCNGTGDDTTADAGSGGAGEGGAPATGPATAGAPTEADVKKAFKDGEEQYDSVNHRWVVAITNIRYGEPRIGDWYKDGTPAGKETIVYPVKLDKTTINKDKTSGEVTSTDDDKDVTTSFFRDDYGDWTYRLTSN